jgi:hypothetical protein
MLEISAATTTIVQTRPHPQLTFRSNFCMINEEEMFALLVALGRFV